jgi:hypothetical protein
VDPGNAGADPADPQTWNGYAYVANNPLSYTDPSGQCWWCDLIGGVLDAIGVLTLDPGLIAGGEAAIGISTAAAIAGGFELAEGTAALGYGIADGVSGGGTSPPWGGSPGGQSPFGLPGQGGCPAGPFANCLAPTPMTAIQTLTQYTLGTLSNVIGAAGLIFTTAGQTQQDEAIWLQTGRLPGLIYDAEHTKDPSRYKWDKHSKPRPGQSPPPNYTPYREYKQPKEKRPNQPEPPKKRRNKYPKDDTDATP